MSLFDRLHTDDRPAAGRATRSSLRQRLLYERFHPGGRNAEINLSGDNSNAA